MLISVDMQRHPLANDADCFVARGLRPASRVQVSFQVTLVAAVMRGDSGEHGLAQQHFHVVTAPIVDPVFQELLLTFAQ